MIFSFVLLGELTAVKPKVSCFQIRSLIRIKLNFPIIIGRVSKAVNLIAQRWFTLMCCSKFVQPLQFNFEIYVELEPDFPKKRNA